MNSLTVKQAGYAFCAALLLAVPQVFAQGEIPAQPSPLIKGAYIAPTASWLITDGDGTGPGYGGGIGFGYRNGWYALEISGSAHEIASRNGSRISQYGGSLNGLLFPLSSFPNVYALLGLGGQQTLRYPSSTGNEKFLITTFSGGVGDLFPLKFGAYEFAIRTEAIFRYGTRAADLNNTSGDLDAPRSFRDVVLNVGLQLPLGLPPPPPAKAPEPPPAVVPPVAAAPPPPPPKPECHKPGPGEKIVLDGCGTGDMIVLEGVKFNFNKATLTLNAKTILDQVGGELTSHADIKVELAGHTDGRGSDAYNLKLSQKRAEAVRNYLIAHGIAADRMAAVGYGKTQPIASNDTDEGREQNRRVELRITAGGPSASPTDVPVSSGASDSSSPPAPPAN